MITTTVQSTMLKHDGAPDGLYGVVQLVQGVTKIKFFDKRRIVLIRKK